MALDVLEIAALAAALLLCCGVLGWALNKQSKKELDFRYPIRLSVGQCLCIVSVSSTLTMLLTLWEGPALILAVLLCVPVALWGIGLGFDISRRNGGHRPDDASGDSSLESKAS